MADCVYEDVIQKMRNHICFKIKYKDSESSREEERLKMIKYQKVSCVLSYSGSEYKTCDPLAL